MNRTKLSVIIPAYNAERSLERTVKSVLAQTVRDLEVLIVDDGSTDGTAAVADQLARADSRVKLIRQTNQRAYAARVNALRQATGEFVAFADADDTLEPTMYQKMLALAGAHDLDAVQCGIYGREKGGEPELLLSREEVLRKYVDSYLIAGDQACFVWDKIYRRNVFEREFEKSTILMFDDLKLNFQFFERVGRLGILHEGLYHYDVNPGSSVANFKLRNVDDLREMIATRRRWMPVYGASPDDLRHARWIVKNVRNFLISACTARAESGAARRANVRAVLAIPELAEALEALKATPDRHFNFVRRFEKFPLFVAISSVRAMMSIHRFLKRSLRRGGGA